MRAFFMSRITWLIAGSLALFLALSAWAISSPVGSSPDDGFHLSNIWCGAGDRPGLCEYSGAHTARVSADLFDQCFLEPHTPASCQGADFGVRMTPNHTVTDLNTETHDYPPVFYAAMSLFASTDLVPSVIAMRLINSALFVGILVLLTVLLGHRWRKPLLVASVAAVVPLGLFIIPSTNPSSWSVIAGITAWAAVAGYVSARGRTRIWLGILASFIVLLGAGSRADSASYMVLSVVLGVMLAWPGSWRSPRLILPAVLVVASLAFFLTARGSLHSVNGFSDGHAPLTWSQQLHLALTNATQIPDLWTGALGGWGLGWLDTGLSAITWVGSSVIFFALLFTGLGVLNKRKTVAIGITALAAFVLPLMVLVRTGAEVGEAVQPRYILPLLAILVGLSVLGVPKRTVRFNRVQAWLIVAVLTVGSTVALYINLGRYQRGLGGIAEGASPWWWTNAVVSPPVVVCAGLLGFGLFALCAMGYARRLTKAEEAIEFAA